MVETWHLGRLRPSLRTASRARTRAREKFAETGINIAGKQYSFELDRRRR